MTLYHNKTTIHTANSNLDKEPILDPVVQKMTDKYALNPKSKMLNWIEQCNKEREREREREGGGI